MAACHFKGRGTVLHQLDNVVQSERFPQKGWQTLPWGGCWSIALGLNSPVSSPDQNWQQGPALCQRHSAHLNPSWPHRRRSLYSPSQVFLNGWWWFSISTIPLAVWEGSLAWQQPSRSPSCHYLAWSLCWYPGSDPPMERLEVWALQWYGTNEFHFRWLSGILIKLPQIDSSKVEVDVQGDIYRGLPDVNDFSRHKDFYAFYLWNYCSGKLQQGDYYIDFCSQPRQSLYDLFGFWKVWGASVHKAGTRFYWLEKGPKLLFISYLIAASITALEFFAGIPSLFTNKGSRVIMVLSVVRLFMSYAWLLYSKMQIANANLIRSHIGRICQCTRDFDPCPSHLRTTSQSSRRRRHPNNRKKARPDKICRELDRDGLLSGRPGFLVPSHAWQPHASARSDHGEDGRLRKGASGRPRWSSNFAWGVGLTAKTAAYCLEVAMTWR